MKGWPLVHPQDDGIRPAGPPDECFYCHQKVGKPHSPECVIVTRRVRVRYTFDIEVDAPYHWDKDDFEYHRNNSSCQNNMIDDVANYAANLADECMCGRANAEFVGVVDNTPRRETRSDDNHPDIPSEFKTTGPVH